MEGLQFADEAAHGYLGCYSMQCVLFIARFPCLRERFSKQDRLLFFATKFWMLTLSSSPLRHARRSVDARKERSCLAEFDAERHCKKGMNLPDAVALGEDPGYYR